MVSRPKFSFVFGFFLFVCAAQAGETVVSSDCRIQLTYRPSAGQVRGEENLAEKLRQKKFEVIEVAETGSPDFFVGQPVGTLFAYGALLPQGDCRDTIPGQSKRGEACCLYWVRLQQVVQASAGPALKTFFDERAGDSRTGPVSCKKGVQVMGKVLPRCRLTPVSAGE